MLQMPDQFGNHNGGSASPSGLTGSCTSAPGDGGGGGDPLGSGRSLATLLAKVLRLDVSPEATTADQPYGIPADNPFVDKAGARREIFVTGLRNPWRFRFDPETEAPLDRRRRPGRLGGGRRRAVRPVRTRLRLEPDGRASTAMSRGPAATRPA
jgi:hypothetical protein